MLECKRPGTFGSITDGLPQLLPAAGEEGSPLVQPLDIAQLKKRARDRIFYYLERGEAKYGIVTCGVVWWFVRRPSPHTLQISPPISWAAQGVQPTVLRPFFVSCR